MAELYSYYEVDRDQGGKKYFHPLNLGAALSTSYQFPIGLSFKIKKYEKIPLPLDLFGDGGLLEPNVDLPSEKGQRVSVGPWWKWKRGLPGKRSDYEEAFREFPFPFAS